LKTDAYKFSLLYLKIKREQPHPLEFFGKGAKLLGRCFLSEGKLGDEEAG
jgi:hypothetical protein